MVCWLFWDEITIKVPGGFHGASLEELDDSECFTFTQPGDHLCTRFECPNCQSQNISSCNLEKDNVREKAFIALIIHATIDVFWAFTSVKAHLSKVKSIARYGEALKLHPLPPLGAIPLYQHGACCKQYCC